MPDLTHVPRDEVAKVWPYLKPRIEYGVQRSHDRMTVEGLYSRAEGGVWDLHFVMASDDEPQDDPIRAVLFTQIFDEMGGDRVLSIRFIAGLNRVEWVWLIMELELYAVKNAVTLMEFAARRAWEKDLKDFDYKTTAIVLTKRLQPKASIHAGRQTDHGSDRAADRPARAAAV